MTQSDQHSPSLPGEIVEEDAFGAALRAFLLRRGIPRHRHTAHLCQVLSLPRHTVYRRLQGTPAFDHHERQLIANFHGISLRDLEELQHLQHSGDAEAPDVQRALLFAELPSRNVRVEFTQTEKDAAASPLRAFQRGGVWEVHRKEDVPEGIDALSVARIIFDVLQLDRVAILEDDAGVAGELRDAIENAGLKADVHSTIESLMAAARAKAYDGYICDWYIKGLEARSVIMTLRDRQATAPIIIATGQMDLAGVTELLKFAGAHQAEILEKPYRSILVAEKMKRAIEANRLRRDSLL